ncbi:hypothetical protein GCM10010448_05880 [Streptomyces glomeratus]|uniref:Uncharacterized protein n=1 Tax=Streptomyces glomeratus TaxID=284452 RepID=A0ABP6L3C0_9ACTN
MLPPAKERLEGETLRVYVGVLVRGVAVGSAEVVLWQRFVARRVPVTQASGRARLGGLRGQPAYERSLHAGRPDDSNVWHGVSPRKALGARKFPQMKSLRNR